MMHLYRKDMTTGGKMNPVALIFRKGRRKTRRAFTEIGPVKPTHEP
jgi:hypothetical protein